MMSSLVFCVLFGFVSLIGIEGIQEFSIQDMQLCGTTLSMPVYTDLFSMRLKLTSGATYSKNLDCTVTIQADLDEKLMVYFEVMDIEETTDCSSDWLEVYDGLKTEHDSANQDTADCDDFYLLQDSNSVDPENINNGNSNAESLDTGAEDINKNIHVDDNADHHDTGVKDASDNMDNTVEDHISDKKNNVDNSAESHDAGVTDLSTNVDNSAESQDTGFRDTNNKTYHSSDSHVAEVRDTYKSADNSAASHDSEVIDTPSTTSLTATTIPKTATTSPAITTYMPTTFPTSRDTRALDASNSVANSAESHDTAVKDIIDIVDNNPESHDAGDKFINNKVDDNAESHDTGVPNVDSNGVNSAGGLEINDLGESSRNFQANEINNDESDNDDDDDNKEGLSYRLCGHSVPPNVYHTSGSYLTIYMKSNDNLVYNGFDLIITRYHDDDCTEAEYEYDNDRCISKSLICTGFNVCGDDSDCQAPGLDHEDLHVGGVVAIACGTVAIILVVVVACFLLARRRRGYVYRERDIIVTVETPRTYGTTEERHPSSSPPPYTKLPPSTEEA